MESGSLGVFKQRWTKELTPGLVGKADSEAKPATVSPVSHPPIAKAAAPRVWGQALPAWNIVLTQVA